MAILSRFYIYYVCFIPLLLLSRLESTAITSPISNQKGDAIITISGGFTQISEVGRVRAIITNSQTVDVYKSDLQYSPLKNTFSGKITVPNFDTSNKYSLYISVIDKDSLVTGKSNSVAVLDTTPIIISKFYPRNLRPNIEVKASFNDENTLDAGQAHKLYGLIQSKNSISSISGKVSALDTFIAQENLQNVNVAFTPPNSNSVYWDLSTDGNTSIRVDSMSCDGNYVLQIAASSGPDVSTLYIPFSIINGVNCKEGIGFNSFIKGSLYNRMGPEMGAFDLINGENVKTSNSAAADLQDASLAGEGHSGVIESGNGSVFIRMNSLNYSTVSLLKVISIFQSERPSSRITDVKVSDIICVKLRAQDLYAVLKITEVDPYYGASFVNNGVIRFDWKLQKN